MSLFLNILWFIFGGLFMSLGWAIAGVFWCITIIGIPLGIQCFKFASLTLAPFGKDVQFGSKVSSIVLNIFWLILTGIPMALGNFIIGCIFCITIIGIPWGLQYFKFAKLALAPFGAEIVRK